MTGDQAARPRSHLPLRPLWLCRVCAALWPCATARLSLRQEHAEHPSALAIYLCTLLYEACADLQRLNPTDSPDPKDLYDRFLAWTRKEDKPAPGEGDGVL